jgi:hypothetical protein
MIYEGELLDLKAGPKSRPFHFLALTYGSQRVDTPTPSVRVGDQHGWDEG